MRYGEIAVTVSNKGRQGCGLANLQSGLAVIAISCFHWLQLLPLQLLCLQPAEQRLTGAGTDFAIGEKIGYFAGS